MIPNSADNIFKFLTHGSVAVSVNVKIAAYDWFRSVVDKCYKILIKKYEKKLFALSQWYIGSDDEQLLHSKNNLNPKNFLIIGWKRVDIFNTFFAK